MARNKNGMSGGLSGTVGNLVTYQSKGESFVRRRPEFKKNRKLSDKQAMQLSKFKLAAAFYRNIKELLESTYEAVQGSLRNAALAPMLTKAADGDPSNPLDYSEARLASGSLKKATVPVASSTQPGILHFSWQSNDVTGARANDKAILIAYCEETQDIWYTLQGPARSTLEGQLDMPFFSGKQVHSWISFISSDGTQVANSSYTGVVQIA